MKAMNNHFPLVLTLISIFSISLSAVYAADDLNPNNSIEELVSKGIVQLQITSTGGHQEECITIIATNISPQPITSKIEAGRRLFSNNENEQDIFIVRDLDFVLVPNETKTLNAYGFCCQSHNSAPSQGASYTIAKMENDNWVMLADIINKSTYPPDAIQNAIWVLSDGHDIRSIPAFSDGDTQNLKKVVANILGVEIPWYSFLYEQDSTQLYTGIANRLFAEVSFTVPRRTMISGQIHDNNGNLVYTFPSYHTSKGVHDFHVDVALDELALGEYRFSIFEDFGVLNTQKRFHLDQEEEG